MQATNHQTAKRVPDKQNRLNENCHHPRFGAILNSALVTRAVIMFTANSSLACTENPSEVTCRVSWQPEGESAFDKTMCEHPNKPTYPDLKRRCLKWGETVSLGCTWTHRWIKPFGAERLNSHHDHASRWDDQLQVVSSHLQLFYPVASWPAP